jgi:hypothetical protein
MIGFLGLLSIEFFSSREKIDKIPDIKRNIRDSLTVWILIEFFD